MLRNDGRSRWVVNFNEPGGKHEAWKANDLKFVSRPAPAPAAGGSSSAGAGEDDDLLTYVRPLEV